MPRLEHQEVEVLACCLLHEAREHVRLRQKVVAVDEVDEISARHLDCAVARGIRLQVDAVRENLHAGVSFRVFGEDRRRAVGGGVVDAKDLDLAQCLRKHRVDAFAQISLCVVDRQYD